MALCGSLAGGGSIELAGATWKKSSRARFFMGFGPTGPGRLEDLIFLSTRKQWAVARASGSEVNQASLGIRESSLWCTYRGGEGIFGGGGFRLSIRGGRFSLGHDVSVQRRRGAGLRFAAGKSVCEGTR
jgi:hypothetical protein